MMRAIWLIRHAESQSNAGEITDSPHSIGLSQEGYRHAGELAERFPEAPNLIVVSGYIRTRLTAQPTIDRFPDVPIIEWPIHEFTFLPPASYAGTTYAQRSEPVHAFWERCEPDRCEGEGAESFNGFMLRIREFLRQLRETPHPFIAVFAHGYVIKAVIWEILYRGDPAKPEFMRGFRALHQCLPVANGAVLPLYVARDGQISVGSPWTHPYQQPPPCVR
jgi:2,3-bisphosphoglycerate-dependent phosphoglycerate mutase